jgi:hypothetical protein
MCGGTIATTPGAACPLVCTGVVCNPPPCPTWQQYISSDDCCPICQICHNGLTPQASPDCSNGGTCSAGYNCEGYAVMPPGGTTWHTIGLCCLDCSRTLCPHLNCPSWQQYIPTGSCCRRCRACPGGSAPLSGNDCAQGACPNGYGCSMGWVDVAPDGTRTEHGICCKA